MRERTNDPSLPIYIFKKVLERALRSFSCVTVGDQICISHNNKFYHIEVHTTTAVPLLHQNLSPATHNCAPNQPTDQPTNQPTTNQPRTQTTPNKIREVQPGDAACIIETDCNVDFEPPIGYQEHARKVCV